MKRLLRLCALVLLTTNVSAGVDCPIFPKAVVVDKNGNRYEGFVNEGELASEHVTVNSTRERSNVPACYLSVLKRHPHPKDDREIVVTNLECINALIKTGFRDRPGLRNKTLSIYKRLLSLPYNTHDGGTRFAVKEERVLLNLNQVARLEMKADAELYYACCDVCVVPSETWDAISNQKPSFLTWNSGFVFLIYGGQSALRECLDVLASYKFPETDAVLYEEGDQMTAENVPGLKAGPATTSVTVNQPVRAGERRYLRVEFSGNDASMKKVGACDLQNAVKDEILKYIRKRKSNEECGRIKEGVGPPPLHSGPGYLFYGCYVD